MDHSQSVFTSAAAGKTTAVNPMPKIKEIHNLPGCYILTQVKYKCNNYCGERHHHHRHE